MNLLFLKDKICSLLIDSSLHDEADAIDYAVKKIVDPKEEDKNYFIDDIASRCNIKWLGDYYIKNIDYNSWVSLLGKLKKEVLKYKKS